jgi:predicted transcriptional regulator
MTLTVRLDETLQAALERYCADTGATKSLVVQESLARYLLAEQGQASQQSRAAKSAPQAAPVSANFRAFQEAGLVGTGELGGGSADKAGVRLRAMQRIRRDVG